MVEPREERHKRLLAEVQALAAEEKRLREEHGIGTKFRTITKRIQALVERLEKAVEHDSHKQVQAAQQKQVVMDEGETLVFVYLFNANGTQLVRWTNLLTASALQEYSVNRPIYGELKHGEHCLMQKADQLKHGLLAVRVKNADILQNIATTTLRDNQEQPLLKLREGALHHDGIVYFLRDGAQYKVGDEGHLVIDQSPVDFS